ncbi:MAG: Serine/threonine-protein kinase PknD [Gemmatimonadaceae bacterium]|nr:Serine/threonine-protein kinase PknD [Gemmatimonadaceae bacterium]
MHGTPPLHYMDDSPSLLGALLNDRYRVLEIIGRGGAATVFKSEDLKHRRHVAVKVLRADTAQFGGPERFAREIALLASLQHPHILALLDSGTIDDHPFFVTPFVQGESLRARLLREARLPVGESLRLLAEVAEALRYAHENGVVHRDVKPENILLSGRHALLSDFGIARLTNVSDDTHNTTSGIAVGTPAYMSPEQAAADPDVDGRADIYALGCVAFEMLAGRPPFTNASPAEILSAHVHKPPPSLVALRPEVGPDVDEIVMRCLAKRVEDRWPSAQDLHARLEPLVVSSGGITPTSRAPVPKFRRARIWLAGLAVAIAGAAVALIWQEQRTRTPEVRNSRRLGASAPLELDAVVSPDGRLLAYAAGMNGSLQIVVRQVDGGGDPIAIARDVAGNQRTPRWTPDGLSVVFGADGSIYRVPALGGRVEALVNGTAAAPAQSPAISPDGGSLAWVQGDGIWIAPLESLAESRRIATDGAAHSVAWSPNSRRLAYVSGNREFALSPTLLGNIAPSVLRVVDVDGGEPASITADNLLATSPGWLSEDDLIFVAAPGSVRDVYTTRVSRRNSGPNDWKRLTTGLGPHSISVSADRKRIVVSALLQESNVYALPIDGRQVADVRDAVALTRGAQIVEDVDVHPATRSLLFDSNQAGSQDLYMMLGGTGRPVQLTFDQRDEFGPSWSPNGREIAYFAIDHGVRHIYVRQLGALGTARQVTNDSLQDHQPRWSPDGERLLFYRRDATGHDRLLVVERGPDSTWSAPQPLGDEFGSGASWSPDGGSIAFRDSLGRIAIMPADGGPSRVVLSPDAVHASAVTRPEWIPFSFDLLVRSQLPGGLGSIWRVPLNADPPREMARFDDPTRPVFRDDYATDGKQIFFTVSRLEGALWLLDLGSS